MPAGLIPALIIGGASAGANLVGAKMASNSAKNAAATQQAGAQQALGVQRQVYNDARARYAPYANVGETALQNLPQIAGRVPYAQYGMSLSGLNQYGQGQPPAGMMAPPSSQGGMVTIEAPTGERRQVPASQAQHYVGQGGKVVG